MNNKNEKLNGTMVNNEKELKQQSKIMEHMPTNKEVKEEGKHPDPAQKHDEKRKE
ncbi:hypothetical protein [Bacillus sp. HMF5848]|uniref:hypothetical protein n=1 Tax=Bacillus sp. HMF5848 TaxID=2495421 RepID=UPI001639E209|nr:hypothetical protein [Bacillus sp. HMF5848]